METGRGPRQAAVLLGEMVNRPFVEKALSARLRMLDYL